MRRALAVATLAALAVAAMTLVASTVLLSGTSAVAPSRWQPVPEAALHPLDFGTAPSPSPTSASPSATGPSVVFVEPVATPPPSFLAHPPAPPAVVHVTRIVPRPRPAPVAAAPSVGAAQAYALRQIGRAQYNCLYVLWMHESGWRTFAMNRSSGAYGIPQALPGSKMASAGADWRTNPITQVRWGLGYVRGAYGSACGAWAFWQAHHWY